MKHHDELSPLQSRLMATYLEALSDQQAKAPQNDELRTEPAPEHTSTSMQSKTAASAPQKSSQSSRSDLYSKKLGELLLKGWRMLAENCPVTGEVPLMQVLSRRRGTCRSTCEDSPRLALRLLNATLSIALQLSPTRELCHSHVPSLLDSQEPNTGRKFSIAVGRFTDEIEAEVNAMLCLDD